MRTGRLIVALAAAAPAAAQPITVTITDDVTDFPAPQTVAQLPGPDGQVSFREACIAANNTPGPNTIEFAIPQSNWWLWTDAALLRQESAVFPLTDDATTVDFTTQTAFTGNTNPNGSEVGIYGLQPNAMGVQSISVSGDHCVIKGLGPVLQRGHAVKLSGNHNRVIGCVIFGPLYSAVYISGNTGSPATGNIVGGTLPGEGNILEAGNSGVRIDTPANDNLVIGNTLSGSFSGVAVRGNPFTGSPLNNRIGGPTPAERNLIAGAGKFGTEGFPTGEQVQVVMATGTLIEGNYIGTTPDGTAPASPQRAPVGVRVYDSIDTTIRNNVIGGIRVVGVNHYAGQVFGDAIRVTTFNAPNTGVTIEGNRIGTDPTGQFPVPSLYGVRIEPTVYSEPITGVAIENNRIAFHERTGLIVADPVRGVVISGNSIEANGGLGIDLVGNPGVTPNDPGDADTGANDLQNFPVLVAATTIPNRLNVTGALSSHPNETYSVEFFAGPACDPSGFGEGARFLGAQQVATDAAGNAPILANLSAPASAGEAITATAIRLATGDTSEFSACVTAEGGSTCYPDCDGDAALTLADFGCFQTKFALADPYADCNGDALLNLADFGCFRTRFALGCP